MIKTCFLGLSMLLFCTALKAQTPGYLGKKYTLQGEFHSFIALYGYPGGQRGLNRYQGNEAGIGLNWSGAVKLGYALTRKHQLMLSYNYFRTGTPFKAYTPNQVLSDITYDTHEYFYDLKGHSGGIGVRIFQRKKGGLAPMGSYIGYGLTATYLQGDSLLYRIGSATQVPGQVYLSPGFKDRTMLYAFNYEIGSNLVLADRFLLNIGIRLNIPLQYARLVRDYSEGLGEPTFPSDYAENNQANFNSVVTSRVALHSFFHFYVGAGFLIF